MRTFDFVTKKGEFRATVSGGNLIPASAAAITVSLHLVGNRFISGDPAGVFCRLRYSPFRVSSPGRNVVVGTKATQSCRIDNLWRGSIGPKR